MSDNPADSLRRGHQPPEPGSQAKPKFGDQITNCMASLDNPHRVGQFVRVVRVTSRMNRGKWWEVTDGEGEFWQCSPANCYVVPVSAGLEAARADEREKIAKAIDRKANQNADKPHLARTYFAAADIARTCGVRAAHVQGGGGQHGK